MSDKLLKEDGDILLQEISDAITVGVGDIEVTCGTVATTSAATAPEMVALAVTTDTIASTSVATAPSDVVPAAGDQNVTIDDFLASTAVANAPTNVDHTLTGGTIAAGSAATAPTLVDHVFTGSTIISTSAVFALAVALAIDGATITSTATLTAPTPIEHTLTGAHLASTVVLYALEEIAHRYDSFVEDWSALKTNSGAMTNGGVTYNRVYANIDTDYPDISVSKACKTIDDGNGNHVLATDFTGDPASWNSGTVHRLWMDLQYGHINSTWFLGGSGSWHVNVQDFIGIGGNCLLQVFNHFDPIVLYLFFGSWSGDNDVEFFDFVLDQATYEDTVATFTLEWQLGTVTGTYNDDNVATDGFIKCRLNGRLIYEASGSDLFLEALLDQDIPGRSVYETNRIETGRGPTAPLDGVNRGFQIFNWLPEEVTAGTIASTSVANAPSTVELGIAGATVASTSTATAPTLVDLVVPGATIPSTAALFAPSTELVITSGTIASTIVLFEPTVEDVGGGAQTVTGEFIPAGSSVFAPTLIDLNVTGAFISAGSQTFAPSTSSDITTGTIASTSTLFAPSLAPEVNGATIASTSATFAPTIEYAVTTGTISSTVTLFSPAVELVITEGTIGSTLNLFAPTIAEDGVVVTDFIPTGSLVHAPSVVAESNITGGTIAVGSNTFSPSTALAIEGATIASTIVVTAPSAISLDITGATRASTANLFAPTVVADAEVTGGTIAAGSNTFAPGIIPDIEVEAGTIAAGGSLFEPTVAPSFDVDITGGTIASGSVLFPPQEVGIPTRISFTNESIATSSMSDSLTASSVTETLRSQTVEES